MAPKDPKLALLGSIPLFARLGARELQRLGELFDQVDVPAGKVLMRQGQTGGEMFVVAGGRLAGIISIGDVVKARIEQVEREAEEMRAYIAAT